MLVAAAAEQSGEVASHVFRCGVDGAAPSRYHFTVIAGLAAADPSWYPVAKTSLDRLGSEKVGVAHAEGFEDLLVKVAVEGLPVHVVTGVFEAMSANPCPWKNSRRP